MNLSVASILMIHILSDSTSSIHVAGSKPLLAFHVTVLFLIQTRNSNHLETCWLYIFMLLVQILYFTFSVHVIYSVSIPLFAVSLAWGPTFTPALLLSACMPLYYPNTLYGLDYIVTASEQTFRRSNLGFRIVPYGIFTHLHAVNGILYISM